MKNNSNSLKKESILHMILKVHYFKIVLRNKIRLKDYNRRVTHGMKELNLL